MYKNRKWYIILVVSLILLILYTGYFFTDIGRGLKNKKFATEKQLSNNEALGNQLLIPPILEDLNPEENKTEFELEVQYGKKELIQGYEAETLGYNGDYLGPVIRVSRNDEVKINVINSLNEPTTVHWHGLEVPGEMDGGPHQVIEPNNSWEPYFTIDQPAATLWYHPHLLHKTGEQVYKDLAGLIYIEDEVSNELDIPKEYGVNDIPLIIQDKRFTDSGKIPYDLTMRDLMNGFLGDTILINGAIKPNLDVKKEIVRFRLLNGSNARSYEFSFSNNTKFYQIASDGGFLEESIKMDSIFLTPAERAEILIDFSNLDVGDTVNLRAGNYELMTINIAENGYETIEIPKDLVQIDQYDRDNVVRSRSFIMSGMGPMVSINGKQMNMDRIDETLNIGELEE